MSTTEPFPSAPAPVQPAPKRSRLRRVLFAVALLVTGGVIGAAVTGPVRSQGWYGPPMHRGWGSHDMGGGRMFGPARAERGVDRVMWFIDASSEQRSKIRGIVERTTDDLLALRDKHVTSHKQISAVLGAATIDRGRLDALRTEQMALADTASKRITDAVAEAAEVLTPTQRADLARWFDRWHRWRHG